MRHPSHQDVSAAASPAAAPPGDPAAIPVAGAPHGPDLARLLRAAAELHLAETEEEALRIVCAAMHNTGWGRVAAYAYTAKWKISASAFAGLTPQEEDQLRNSRATEDQRRALFAPGRSQFLVSRSYFIPADRRGELVDPSPVVPSHRPRAAAPSGNPAAGIAPAALWDPADVAYTPLLNAAGNPIGLVMYDDPVSLRRPDEESFRYIEFFAGAAARVIEQIRTTQRLRRTEYRLSALLESMPDVVFYESGQRSHLISRNLQALLGIPAEDVERSEAGLSGLLDPRDVERVRARQEQWEAEGAPGTLITRARMRTADGGHRWIEDRSVRLPAQGDGRRRAGVMIDVTEQVEIEEALREREQRFHMVTLATRDAIYDWNIATGKVWSNEALADILGARGDSTNVDWWRQRIHPDDLEPVLQSLDAAIASGQRRWQAEYRLRKADGDYAHVQDRAFLMPDESGRIARLIGAMSDITARKEAEQRQTLMLRELDHRVKNNLAAVMVLAEQSLRAAPTLAHFERSFSSRLRALARTHEVLAESQWRSASLEGIVRQTLAPYTVDDPGRLVIAGEPTPLPARMAAPLALALNELATNAVKYGALSTSVGWVGVAWKQVHDPHLGAALQIDWTEHGGPAVCEPQARGFGTRLIDDEARFQLRGRSEIHFDHAGVRCQIVAPLSADARAPAPPV